MMASNAPLWCSSLNSNQILKLALRVKQSSSTSRRSRRNCCSSVLQRFSRWLLFCQDGSGAEQRRNTGSHQTGSKIWENRWRWKYDKYSGGVGTHYCARRERGEGFSAADKDLGILDPAEPSRLHHLMAHFFPSSFLPHPHSSFISSTSWNSNSEMFHHLSAFSPSWFFFHFLIHMNPPYKTLNPLCKTFKGKISLGNECPFVDVKFSLNVWKMFAPTKLIWEPHSNKNSRDMYF